MSDGALYVYGVVPKASPADLFADVRGVDPSQRVVLVHDGEAAAVASSVRLDEFGEAAITENLRDPSWLAEKARAHDHVLAAAVGRTTILPFRFGTIYSDEEQVRKLLRERSDFSAALRRLEGAIELGVKAFVDLPVLRERLAAAAGDADEDLASTGRAYMQRKQLERQFDEDAARFAMECAHESHELLANLAKDARTNPLQQPQEPGTAGRMILNGAYLVAVNARAGFDDALRRLEQAHAADGVRYELTGPWPPYNFVEDEQQS